MAERDEESPEAERVVMPSWVRSTEEEQVWG
jgi:hypothetical protein